MFWATKYLLFTTTATLQWCWAAPEAPVPVEMSVSRRWRVPHFVPRSFVVVLSCVLVRWCFILNYVVPTACGAATGTRPRLSFLVSVPGEAICTLQQQQKHQQPSQPRWPKTKVHQRVLAMGWRENQTFEFTVVVLTQQSALVYVGSGPLTLYGYVGRLVSWLAGCSSVHY